MLVREKKGEGDSGVQGGMGEHTQLDHESNEAERISVHYDASYIS